MIGVGGSEGWPSGNVSSMRKPVRWACRVAMAMPATEPYGLTVDGRTELCEVGSQRSGVGSRERYLPLNNFQAINTDN